MSKISNIVEAFIKLKDSHPDWIVDETHAGKSFYLAYNDSYFGPRKTKFGGGFPFYASFIKNGKVNFIGALNKGFAEEEIEKIEKNQIQYISANRKEMDRVKLKLEKFLLKDIVLKNSSLEYYSKKILFLNKLLLELLEPYELSIFINPYLEICLDKLFPNSDIPKEDLLRLAVSQEKTNSEIHELKAGEVFRDAIKVKNYKKFINYPQFKNKLIDSYNHGYFLHSTIGGVRVWSLKDEFNYIVNGNFDNTKAKLTDKNSYFLDLSLEQQQLLTLCRHFSYQRDERKTLQLKLFYHQYKYLQEVSKKFDIDTTEMENLKPIQLSNLILKTKEDLLNQIEINKKGYLFITVEDFGYSVVFGEKANTLYKQIKFEHAEQNIIYGQTANIGHAIGRVRVIYNTTQDFVFEDGDILVSGMTYPDFMPLMKKSSAVVTDVGGITCHAAIITRELGKPCIIGTKVATKILKDGDLVEVDAGKGLVKILKRSN